MAHQFKVKRKDGKGWWTLPHMDQDQIDGLTLGKDTALHKHDQRYYTETQLDAGQLDNRYYTETEINAKLNPLGTTGWETPSDLVLSWDNPSRTLTITPTGTQVYWTDNTRYTISSPASKQILDTSGVHIIYFDGSTISDQLDPNHQQMDAIIKTKCLVAWVYWNATDGDPHILGTELHGTVMASETHHYLHDTVGSRFRSGGDISGYTLKDTADASVTFDLTNVIFYDEDIDHYVADGLVANQYEQVLTGDAEIPVLYKDDIDGTWTQQAASTLPYIVNGSDFLTYMNDDGDGTWSQVELQNNKFMNYVLIATNDWEYPIKMVQGTTQYNKAKDAQEGLLDERISWGTMPSDEFTALYVFTLKRENGGTKNLKIEELVDYRFSRVSGSTVAQAQAHSSLYGLTALDHPASAITTDTTSFDGILSIADDTVQKALDTIDEFDGSEFLRHDGTVQLSDDWDVGLGHIIRTDEIRSRLTDSPPGLTLSSRGGTAQAYIFVGDGNFNIGINKIGSKVLDIYSPTATPVIRCEIGAANCFIEFIDSSTGGNKVYLGAIGNDMAIFADGTTAIRYTTGAVIDVGNSASILDEDDLGTDSDTQLATQQSIKKYVDDIRTMPSGATQGGAGVGYNEFWRTLNHATLPDHLVMIGISTTTTTTTT